MRWTRGQARTHAAHPELAASTARKGREADFDGDSVPDDAILVPSPHNAGGIAILWGHGGTDLLGAGRHQCWLTSEQSNLDGSPVDEPCLEPIDPDLAWISRWNLLTRTPADPAPILRRPASTKSGHPAPGALCEALLLDSGDAATALYRTSSGWTLMHLGY